ncbi:hypothetical protein DHODJN_16425 [Methylorubrum extorquens]
MVRCGGRSVTGAAIRLEHSVSRGAWACSYYTMTNSNLEGPGNLIDMDVVSTFRMRDCLNYIRS